MDLEAGKLQVWRTISLTRQGHVFEPPKNGKGRCTELTENTSDALKCHLTDQLEEIEALGDEYQDQGLIFTGEKGQPMRPWTLTRVGRRGLRGGYAAGPPHVVHTGGKGVLL